MIHDDRLSDEAEEHLRRCKLPCLLQDEFILDGDAPTQDAIMITWEEIMNDKNCIKHFYPPQL